MSAGALLALLLAWFIIHMAMRKLGADPGVAMKVARRVASGDLEFEMEARRHDAISLMGALRQMKDSLQHSKLDYQGQINAIAKVQGVIECSVDGDVTNANEIFLNVLGYSLEDVKAKNYSMFVDSQDSAANQGLWQALQRGESRQGEFRVVGRGKQEVWLRGVFNPIADATGKPFKIVAYLNDVTKQRQEALLNAAFRGALEQGGGEPVGKRLGFLLQEMLREANTTGSKANDAVMLQDVVTIKEELERIREQVENLE